jgi:uncharacterized membrane protein YfcA
VLTDLLLDFAFGCLAGVLSGLFGVGGGAVLVPFLVWQFGRQGFPEGTLMVAAVATSLATIVVTGTSSMLAHHRRGAVHWPTVAQLLPGILLGSLAGSSIAERLPVEVFKVVFAAFLIIIAVRMLMAGRHHGERPRPGRLGMASAGAGIGTASTIVGIGGGSLTVPFLERRRYSIREAVAISSALGVPIALAGTAGYVLLGWDYRGLPEHSLGYVYWPAAAAIVAGSVPFAPLGASLAHRLPTARLKHWFAVVLIGIGGKMLWPAVIAGLRGMLV